LQKKKSGSPFASTTATITFISLRSSATDFLHFYSKNQAVFPTKKAISYFCLYCKKKGKNFE